MSEYADMLRIQKIRQAEIAAWRQEQDAARDLEIASLSQATSHVLPSLPLSEPIEDEDAEVEVSVPVVEIEMPKPKAKQTKSVRVGSDDSSLASS